MTQDLVLTDMKVLVGGLLSAGVWPVSCAGVADRRVLVGGQSGCW